MNQFDSKSTATISTMNNEIHLPMNIHQLTQQIVNSAVEVNANEFDVLHRLPTKSLQEMNDACLADIHEMTVAPGGVNHSGESNSTNRRPTKRHKSSSEGTSDDDDYDDEDEDEDLTTKNDIKDNEHYDEGMNVYKTPIHISDLPDLLHSSSSIMAALLYNLGLANLQGDQEDTALRLFHMALDMYQKDDGSNISALLENNADHDVDEITILHNIGCIYYHQQEYERALKTFTRVEVLSLVKHGSHHLTVASALNCIGVVLFHSTINGTTPNNNKNILDNLYEALSIRKAILGNEHRDVATSLNNIGRVYFDTADYTNAILYYQESLQIRRRILGQHHMDVSATAFNAGQTCHKLGDLDQALPLYREYFDITSKKLGNHHQGTITVLKHIGQVFHEKNQVKEALSHYHDALTASRVLGHYNREVASILNLLGNLHYENGEFDKAIEVYEEGLLIERAVLHRHCSNVVVTLSNIGQALMQKGEYQAALLRYNEVHFIQSLQAGRNVKKISETLSICGQIHTLLGKYSQAEKVFLKVISMSSREGASSSGGSGDHADIDVALALNYLGLVYFKQGALNSAMENFQKSLRFRLCAPKTSNDVAVLLYNIASIYLHQGDNESALAHYKRALEVERRALGHDHPDVAITLKLIGKVYDRCGQYEEAIQHYSEALDICTKCYDDSDTSSSSSSSTTTTLHHPNGYRCKDVRDHKKNAARILALIASIHLRQANTVEMTRALSQAYRLFQEIGAPVRELELETGFDLYELSILHPECAAAA